MVYLFRWRCADPPAELTIAVEAETDRYAGELAAAMIHDFARGRHRYYRFEPAAPIVAPGTVR